MNLAKSMNKTRVYLQCSPIIYSKATYINDAVHQYKNRWQLCINFVLIFSNVVFLSPQFVYVWIKFTIFARICLIYQFVLLWNNCYCIRRWTLTINHKIMYEMIFFKLCIFACTYTSSNRHVIVLSMVKIHSFQDTCS